MNIELKKWLPDDGESLANICNRVPRGYFSNRMPYLQWLGKACEQEGEEGVFRSIIVDGEIVGNISVEKKADVYGKDAVVRDGKVYDLYVYGKLTEKD